MLIMTIALMGMATTPALQASTSAQSALVAKTKAGTVYKQGDVGPEVREIRKALRKLNLMKEDEGNRFGSKTEQAVMAFQRLHGLEDDGMVGEDTAPLLMGTSTDTVPQTARAAPLDASYGYSAKRPRKVNVTSNSHGAMITQSATKKPKTHKDSTFNKIVNWFTHGKREEVEVRATQFDGNDDYWTSLGYTSTGVKCLQEAGPGVVGAAAANTDIYPIGTLVRAKNLSGHKETYVVVDIGGAVTNGTAAKKMAERFHDGDPVKANAPVIDLFRKTEIGGDGGEFVEVEVIPYTGKPFEELTRAEKREFFASIFNFQKADALFEKS